jgi:class 3 adenylate cyclase
VTSDDELKLHSHRLWRLIDKRTQHGTDVAELDRQIWDLFGQRCALMFTDLSGFSRNVEAFGILHFLQVIHESRKVFFPIIDEHRGILIKSEADSLLLMFRSPDAALDCAVAMQRACEHVNQRRRPEEQILLCVGMGYGDVLCVGYEDVWGREVNAASKLGEDTAKAGEILVTSDFLEGLRDKNPERFEQIASVAGSERNYRYLGAK